MGKTHQSSGGQVTHHIHTPSFAAVLDMYGCCTSCSWLLIAHPHITVVNNVGRTILDSRLLLDRLLFTTVLLYHDWDMINNNIIEMISTAHKLKMNRLLYTISANFLVEWSTLNHQRWSMPLGGREKNWRWLYWNFALLDGNCWWEEWETWHYNYKSSHHGGGVVVVNKEIMCACQNLQELYDSL